MMLTANLLIGLFGLVFAALFGAGSDALVLLFMAWAWASWG